MSQGNQPPPTSSRVIHRFSGNRAKNSQKSFADRLGYRNSLRRLPRLGSVKLDKITTPASIAMAGVIIYVIVDVVLQSLPPHYSPIREAESNLAVGPFGWIMAINFFGRGITCAALILALVRAMPRSLLRDAGLIFMAAAGLCSAAIAFLPTDVPKGGGVHAATLHGAIHLVGASTGFVTALIAIWLLSFCRLHGGRLSAASLVFLGIATAGLAFLGVTLEVSTGMFGLAERVCLVGILGWVFSTALSVRRRSRQRTGSALPAR